MAYLELLSDVHARTRRDYLARILQGNKAELATLARKFSVEYWDGDRSTGYGGYHYDGRWLPVAQRLGEQYALRPGDRILDVGCGKGFLLHELTRACPGVEVIGLDVSAYALHHAKPEVVGRVVRGTAVHLPFPDHAFDLVVSINTLHNLFLPELDAALREIERVGRRHKYVVMDSYRSEQEKLNLMCWQLTCECFFTPVEWAWILERAGYTGDHGCIFFE